MTPAARISAAIEILDTVRTGQAAEKALTNWARANRYAGSKDRAAIRDHVFDALRRKRSAARRGGGDSGRGLMLGLLSETGPAPDTLFTGARFAPQPLSDAEQALCAAPPALSDAEALDLPDWLLAPCRAALGRDELLLLRDRAPLFVRVNLARTSRDEAAEALAGSGIDSEPHALSPSALLLRGYPRGLKTHPMYLDGTIELQDAASQAAADMVPVAQNARVLDYCAGGGGKLLALAARVRARYHAHDIDPGRMTDLPARAERAGVSLRMVAPGGAPALAPFDTVLCDAPCTGSGAWRRAPAGKWSLRPDGVERYLSTQADILDQAAPLVAGQGVLVFMTCSILRAENEDQVAAFLTRHPNWIAKTIRRFGPGEGGDGFFVAILKRK